MIATVKTSFNEETLSGISIHRQVFDLLKLDHLGAFSSSFPPKPCAQTRFITELSNIYQPPYMHLINPAKHNYGGLLSNKYLYPNNPYSKKWEMWALDHGSRIVDFMFNSFLYSSYISVYFVLR